MSTACMVSVIIPTYNRAHLVSRAIGSVLAQTFQDLEILVVDDGSTDNTEEVIQAFRDPRIQYLRHQVNKGATAARNTGIKVARGEYVGFLDSDDEWLPEKLEKQLQVFKTNPNNIDNLGVVLTAGKAMIGEKTIQAVSKKRGYIYPYLFKNGIMSNFHTLLVRKSCLLEVGLYDETLPASQQWDLMVRLAATYNFDFVDTPLAITHRHQGDHVRVRENVARAYDILLQKYAVELVKYPRFRDQMYAYLITHHLRRTEIPEAREKILRGIRSNPWRIRFYGYLLLSLVDGQAYQWLTRLKRGPLP